MKTKSNDDYLQAHRSSAIARNAAYLEAAERLALGLEAEGRDCSKEQEKIRGLRIKIAGIREKLNHRHSSRHS